jgi:hypothetical protein
MPYMKCRKLSNLSLLNKLSQAKFFPILQIFMVSDIEPLGVYFDTQEVVFKQVIIVAKRIKSNIVATS